LLDKLHLLAKALENEAQQQKLVDFGEHIKTLKKF
jgi:hypothetical protein